MPGVNKAYAEHIAFVAVPTLRTRAGHTNRVRRVRNNYVKLVLVRLHELEAVAHMDC
jgi:hypothetical protein